MWECDVEGWGSPVPVRNRLRLGVLVQGTPEGGRRVWENAGARVGFISAVVWGAEWVVGLGAGLGGISWRGKKTPAFPGFGSTLLES